MLTPASHPQRLARPVDFLLVGPQGTGEQWLATQIGKHPGVCFLRPLLPYQGQGPQDEMQLALALGGEPGRRDSPPSPPPNALLGHVDHRFATLTSAQLDRLAAARPGLRVIITQRPPLQRRLSAAAWALEVAQLEPGEASPAWLMDWRHSAFQRLQGDDTAILAAWHSRFDKEQILVLPFRELLHRPAASLAAAWRHLGLEEALDLGHDAFDLRGERSWSRRWLPPLGSAARRVIVRG